MLLHKFDSEGIKNPLVISFQSLTGGYPPHFQVISDPWRIASPIGIGLWREKYRFLTGGAHFRNSEYGAQMDRFLEHLPARTHGERNKKHSRKRSIWVPYSEFLKWAPPVRKRYFSRQSPIPMVLADSQGSEVTSNWGGVAYGRRLETNN